jgi:hypothetical protein
MNWGSERWNCVVQHVLFLRSDEKGRTLCWNENLTGMVDQTF